MNNKVKVLIGDDSAETGVSVANKLREKGMYAYTRRRDCGIILESIKKDPPDVAVMDISSQNGDVISVMRTVRDSGIKPPVFIITSAYDNEFIERQVMENGASRFMLRPYSADDLCTAINSSLGDRVSSLSDDMEVVVTDMIHQLGVPAHIKGYHYLRTAILYSIKDKTLLDSVTKLLYPTVAGIYDTTFITGGTRYPPRYRNSMGQRKCGYPQLVLRLYRRYRQGQAHKFGIYRSYNR